jgi:hypothetical protein
MAVELKDPAEFISSEPITPEVAEAQKLTGTDPLVFQGTSVGDSTRLLLAAQELAAQNGLWKVTKNEAFGGGGEFGGAGKFGEGEGWELNRTADADSTEEVKNGMLVPVMDGTLVPRSSWILNSPDPVEVGVDDQTFLPLVGTNSVN